MIAMRKSRMASVFNLLIILLQLHLRIEKTVLVNILLIFDLLMIGKFRAGCLMLLFQLSDSLLIFFLRQNLLLIAAFFHLLIIIFVKMLF